MSRDRTQRGKGAGVTAPDGAKVHIHPTYGREHEMSLACWCVLRADQLDPRVVIHRDPN